MTYPNRCARNALIGGGLAGALGWAEDLLARTSTAVGKVFARLGPLGAMFATAAAPTALVYQVYTEYIGIFRAARRGLETGDFRLLLVRYYCANIRILQMVVQFRMSLPGQTNCGTGGNAQSDGR